MFDILTDRFTQLRRKFLGYGRLSDLEIKEAIREIRTVLLEADVNYKVVGHFVRRFEAEIKEQNVAASLRPGEIVNAAIYRQLIDLLGTSAARIDLTANPTVVSLVGLQGTGKTTFAGKLACLYHRRKPLLVACDPKRPAASEQLESVARRAQVDFHAVADDVVATCLFALRRARDAGNGVVILDTAGRLHVDEDLMSVLGEIEHKVRPHVTLLVLDGMVGQDAVSQASEFSSRLKLTGCCFTKLDGDARGGAVLSVRHVTGLPIHFIGTGEHLDDIEEFYPDRFASRILGLGDMKSLSDRVRAATENQDQRVTAQKFLKGRFDLEDFLNQLRSLKKIGSLSKLLAMIPGGSKLEVDDRELVRVEAMIQSMTPAERHDPDIIDGSRRRRIAAGSGMQVSDVNNLLKEFHQARAMARQLSGTRRGRFPPPPSPR